MKTETRGRKIKLDEIKKNEIIRSPLKVSELAKIYSVSQRTIYDVLNGRQTKAL